MPPGGSDVGYEDLLKSVEESAAEKELELRNKAALAVDEIRDRAKRQAETIRKGHVDEVKRSLTTEQNKLLYLTKAENKENLIRVRETAFGNAFREAEARLASLRTDPKYPVVFEKLLREAAASIGSNTFTVHIDPRDEALCTKALAALSLTGEIRADITTSGGVVLNLPGDTVVISNTVESRLQRAREHKRIEIHAILSGE
jgi:V/A-type H+/Na+-transporting ATPase subunit E